MKVNLTKEQWLGVIRHSLTFIGGLLLAKGIIDALFWAEFSGGLLTLIGSIWSVIEKESK